MDSDEQTSSCCDENPTASIMESDLHQQEEEENERDGEHQSLVSYVSIRGLSMLSLAIDGEQRVCLSQISNTLLKRFSYNEIHNRRVALGINCIQCSPLQLELLRKHGAMAASSRRCGMITRKEAERLVKSFLDESKPPALPENFSFCVEHRCEFGCQGTFYPCRYNSSRAKCIRCIYCKLFFSPNKFIFHSHQGATFNMQRHFPTTSNSSKLSPSISASSSTSSPSSSLNFNSWRKHIFLINPNNDEELSSAWEDVKSIFNSGKRKRSSATFDSTSTATRSQIYGHSSSQIKEHETAAAAVTSEPLKKEEQEKSIPQFYEATANNLPYHSSLLLNFVNLLQSSSQHWNNSRAFEFLCREQATGIVNNSTIKTETESQMNGNSEWNDEDKTKKSNIKFSIDSLIKK